MNTVKGKDWIGPFHSNSRQVAKDLRKGKWSQTHRRGWDLQGHLICSIVKAQKPEVIYPRSQNQERSQPCLEPRQADSQTSVHSIIHLPTMGEWFFILSFHLTHAIFMAIPGVEQDKDSYSHFVPRETKAQRGFCFNSYIYWWHSQEHNLVLLTRQLSG